MEPLPKHGTAAQTSAILVTFEAGRIHDASRIMQPILQNNPRSGETDCRDQRVRRVTRRSLRCDLATNSAKSEIGSRWFRAGFQVVPGRTEIAAALFGRPSTQVAV
jgi:hypothetical protein